MSLTEKFDHAVSRYPPDCARKQDGVVTKNPWFVSGTWLSKNVTLTRARAHIRVGKTGALKALNIW